MAESLFDIFGDHITKQLQKPDRHSASSAENLNKPGLKGPFKPVDPKSRLNINENITPLIPNKGKSNVKSAIKPKELSKNEGEVKKSFLSNVGKSIQSTPVRQVFTPRPVNVGTLIYKEANVEKENNFEEDLYEFTKPAYKKEKDCINVFDYLSEPEIKYMQSDSPINTPPPKISHYDMEYDLSPQKDLFRDDLSEESLTEPDMDFSEIF